jgi:hypothetical protein
LRLGADFFFGSKRSHRNPFFYDRVGYREIGVELLAVESIESLGDRELELQEFFLTRH